MAGFDINHKRPPQVRFVVYLPKIDDFTSADSKSGRDEQCKHQNGGAAALDRRRGHCVMLSGVSACIRGSDCGSNQTSGALEEGVGAEFE
jgi:hypothetical protein